MSKRRSGVAELLEIESVFSAIAHETRRHILLVLHARGDRVRAGEIAARFSCAWPTTTRHLSVLVESGLVEVERDGRERWYTLRTDVLNRVAGGWLAHFRSPDRAATSHRSDRDS